MNNAVTILISNNTGIDDSALYIFITDGDNNFYLANAGNNWVATPQTTACSMLLTDLQTQSPLNGLYSFYFDANSNVNSGRVWFSNSATALSVNSAGGIAQPTVTAGFVFDFMEITTNPMVGTTPGNANIDTTQVDALGIPITLYVNPTQNNLTFPPLSTGSLAGLGYPNVLGIVPWLSLQEIITGFLNNISATAYAPYSICNWSGGPSSSPVSRFVAPFHLISDYVSGTAPSALATFFDQAIFQFFNYYINNSLTLQDPVSLNYYTGQVTTVTETDTTGGTSTYNVLQFSSPGDTEVYNVYFPYFSTNCAAFPGTLSANVTLSPPPAWWTSNPNSQLDTAMPATAMLLGCAGTFSDSAFQQNVTNTTLLGNLENQVASLLNRGLSPVINNLIAFNAQYSAADIQYNQVSITTLPDNVIITTGMDMVKQIAAQPLTVVSSATVGNSTKQIIITNPAGPVLPVNSCLFLCGQFYPQTSNAAGYSNIYSNYLHNGLGTAPAPLLNNIGYGYAYDDQGGYSNDVTVNYDSNNSLTLGIFLGPLQAAQPA